MIIEIAGQEFEAKPWWRWVCINDDGCVFAFWDKPLFQYWLKYKNGRFWNTPQDDSHAQYLGYIDKDMAPREILIKL